MKAAVSLVLLFVVFIAMVPQISAMENSLENREQQADRYLSVNSPQDIFQSIADQTKDTLPLEEQQTFIDMLTKYLDMDALASAMKKSLIKNFTAEEISALANFYSMPGSRSAMNKMGIYMADVIPVVHDEMIKAQERAFEAQKKRQEISGEPSPKSGI